MLQTQVVIAIPRRVLCALLLASLCSALFWSVAAAQTSEEGCSCHSLERSAWEVSTHGQLTESGQPIAACETCHGDYTRDHPDADMIPLATDSSTCIECHSAIAHNWEETVHAEAGVQCIGCHMAHSQDLRLGDVALCESCHRESLQDPLHTAHWLESVTCTSCHMADEIQAVDEKLVSADPALMLLTAPRHDFVAISGSNCIDCHAQQVRDGNSSDNQDYHERLDIIQAAAEAPVLRTQLTQAEHATLTATSFVPMGIGFGISVGGILGIAFVLTAARWGRKENQ